VDDRALVTLVAKGNLDALGILFDRHEPAVRRLFVRLGVADADADDLVQTTFLQVLRAAPRFDSNIPAKPWLLGIAAMMARRHRRSVGQLAARLREWALAPREELAVSPAVVFERTESERRFLGALESLSAAKREAFVLVTLEGMSGEDAAALLKVPVNTIWTRLHHARRELRALLAGGT
jgi:RNA polymerase sigma-70 factor (ECF subfamily)